MAALFWAVLGGVIAGVIAYVLSLRTCLAFSPEANLNDSSPFATFKRLWSFPLYAPGIAFSVVCSHLIVSGTSCLVMDEPIASVTQGGAASKAGINEFDTLYKVDGVLVSDIDNLEIFLSERMGRSIEIETRNAVGGGAHLLT